MISLSDYAQLEESIKDFVEKVLNDVARVNPIGYLMLLAGADYDPTLEKTNLSPYIINTSDRLFAEETRMSVLLSTLNRHYNQVFEGKTEQNETVVETTNQLQVYSQIWESDRIQKTVRRLAYMLAGKKYEWRISTKTNTGSFLADVIEKAGNHPLGVFLNEVYNKDWRNNFSHGSFYIDDKNSMLYTTNNDGLLGNPRISLIEWETLFLKASMFSFYLLETIISRRNNLPAEEAFVIPIPMKENSQMVRNVVIYSHILVYGGRNRIYFNFQ